MDEVGGFLKMHDVWTFDTIVASRSRIFVARPFFMKLRIENLGSLSLVLGQDVE